MSRVEFDELLRQKMDSEELEVDPAHWERLAALLPPAAAKRGPVKVLAWATGIAASIAVLIAATWLFTGKNNYRTGPPVASEKPAHRNPVFPEPVPDTAGPASGQSSQPLNGLYGSPGRRSLPDNNNHINSNNIAYKAETLPAPVRPEATEAAGVPLTGREGIAVNNNPGAPSDKKHTVDVDKESYTYRMPEIFPASSEPADKDSRTSIALGGGVNYGTMNTGYTLGLSARRYVSDRVFVDGTVAVLMNKNSESALNYTGNFFADQEALTSNARARPSSENYYYPAQGFYYIQFNPALGYKVTDKVAMSVGGDFQQMLQNSANNETVLFTNGEDARLFPTFDVGVTGKTEINITPAIQAGVLYREGLNNLIRNETRYVNRRYIQVQVKYSLPLR